jgi:putative membrane protein
VFAGPPARRLSHLAGPEPARFACIVQEHSGMRRFSWMEYAMKKVIVLAAACALLAAPAAAQTMKDRAKHAAETTGVGSAMGLAPTTQDFVKNAAMSDMLEIESSKLAQEKADAQSKEFAGHMVQDHSKTSSELKQMIDSGKVQAQLPMALDDAHQKKLDKLKAMNGKDFDKNYDSMQKSAHKDAVSLFERYAKAGDNPELKAWAAKTLPDLKNHYQMAQKLK